MPVQPTYPGVYIEELPSGVRTITGVATSITAFIGRAQRGPVNEPITINNFADFERKFGGLWKDSSLGFAVRDFYLNGGSQAIIVRLFKEGPSGGGTGTGGGGGPANPEAETGAEPGSTTAEGTAATADSDFDDSKAKIDANGLAAIASYPGTWGNHLRVIIDHQVSGELAERFGLEATDLFNLSVQDTQTGLTEEFRNVSVKDSPRVVDKILENGSTLIRVDEALPPAIPTPHPESAPGEDRWGDNEPVTNSKVEDDKGSDGDPLDETVVKGSEANKTGIFALENADLFNILCVPPYNVNNNVDDGVWTKAAVYCEKRRAMLVVDPPSGWVTKDEAKKSFNPPQGTTVPPEKRITTRSRNAAIFFPRLRQPNSLRDNQVENFVPCGAVAGIFARTDGQRGVWKAPAGLTDGILVGVPELSVPLTDPENGELNPLGINCLRVKPPAGRLVWGSRTLKGDDRFASEWKYISVRRTALFIEESLFRGTQWVVFEPNDEPTWAQIRLNVGAFMQNLFRQGAFQGSTPKDAYLVKCDGETTTQNDIDLGIVNILVGFAPLKPAEFVIIKIQQLAGQIEV